MPPFLRSEPRAGEGGAVPRGSHYAYLGAPGARVSGRAEARRAPEEVVSMYIQNCQLFVYVGALLGPDLGVAQNPHYYYYSRRCHLKNARPQCSNTWVTLTQDVKPFSPPHSPAPPRPAPPRPHPISFFLSLTFSADKIEEKYSQFETVLRKCSYSK